MLPAFYLSAAHKSSGKTVVSLGLCAALKAKSFGIQTFKKGPDYIDPIWLTQASGKPCYNLDFYNMTKDEIMQLYSKYTPLSDISIVEGNKGLFDGMNTTGGDANADLAKSLDLPVVLVIDTVGMTRGVAALVSGYQAFDQALNIQGVILNKVAGQRHQSKLVAAIEHYTDIKVLGAVRKSKDFVIDERHLGLMPANETFYAQTFINKVGERIADQVDVHFFMPEKTLPPLRKKKINLSYDAGIVVAVARDQVFGFYYQDDLDKFAELGVQLKFFDTLKDARLPNCDGLFIGGGFPEMQLNTLNANTPLLADIKTKIEAGLPTYAECGGLMYLSKSIENHAMVGIIDAHSKMNKKPIGRGYVQLEPTAQHPWRDVAKHIYAHEFHYSKLENINPKTCYAYKVLRGVGVDNKHDGILVHNLLATYTHLRDVAGNHWVAQFVNFIKKVKAQKS